MKPPSVDHVYDGAMPVLCSTLSNKVLPFHVVFCLGGLPFRIVEQSFFMYLNIYFLQKQHVFLYQG